MKTKIAAIALDNHKFPVFERHLNEAGYTFTKINGITEDTMILRVPTENMQKLAQVVLAAEKECKK